MQDAFLIESSFMPIVFEVFTSQRDLGVVGGGRSKSIVDS